MPLQQLNNKNGGKMRKLNRRIFGVLFLLAFSFLAERSAFALKPPGTITIKNLNCIPILVGPSPSQFYIVSMSGWAGCNAEPNIPVPIPPKTEMSFKVPREVPNSGHPLSCDTYHVYAQGAELLGAFHVPPDSKIECKRDPLTVCQCYKVN